MTPIVLCRQNKFFFNRYMYKNVYLKKWPQPSLSKSYFDQQCPTLTPKKIPIFGGEHFLYIIAMN